MMLLVIGTIQILPEKLDEARPIMQRMIDASRSEDGCIAYAYSQDVIEPGVIHISEAWRDRDALDKHFASCHLADWRGHWERLGISDRDLHLYEARAAQRI